MFVYVCCAVDIVCEDVVDVFAFDVFRCVLWVKFVFIVAHVCLFVFLNRLFWLYVYIKILVYVQCFGLLWLVLCLCVCVCVVVCCLGLVGLACFMCVIGVVCACVCCLFVHLSLVFVIVGLCVFVGLLCCVVLFCVLCLRCVWLFCLYIWRELIKQLNCWCVVVVVCGLFCLYDHVLCWFYGLICCLTYMCLLCSICMHICCR